MGMRASVAVTLAVLVGTCRAATAQEPTTSPTLEEAYLGLSSGPLRAARLMELPQGVVLQASATQITAEQVAAEIEKAKQDPETYAALQKNAFFVLENLATRALLLAEARAWAQEVPSETREESDHSLIETYLRNLASQVQVTEEEARAFFAANEEMFGGASYEQAAEALRAYLQEQKQQDEVQSHVNRLSERTRVELDTAWVDAQAATALDTPVDRARRSGRATVADFGATGCGPCDMMAPILEELREEYAERCNVVFVQVGEQPILGARYGVRAIPVQIIFDALGKEVFRHVGFLPKDPILGQLAELGVQ